MLSRSALAPWLRRPAAVGALSAVALTALLSGGLVVAHAVDGTPVADTTATATPSAGSNAGGNGTDNVAGAVNTKDGKTVYAIRIKIVQTSSSTVDATNAAVAVASCSDCTTVAIAFEGVLVSGTPTDFQPTNLALAYNVNCTGCTTVAEAYQRVVQSSTRVRITREGRKEIAAIRRELNGLRRLDLSYDQIAARVEALEQRFAAVLTNDVVPVGHVHDPAPAGPDVSDVVPSPGAGDPSAAPASAQPGSAEPSSSSSAAPGSATPSSTTPSSSSSQPEPAPSASDSPSPAPGPTGTP